MTAPIAEVTVENVDHVLTLIEKMPRRISRKHLRRATNQSAALLRKELRATAPKESGKLRKNIISKGRKAGRTYTKATVYVRAAERTQGREYGGQFMATGNTAGRAALDPKDSFYWRFVEYGTKYQPAQHFIRDAGKKMLDPVTRHIFAETERGIIEELRKAK